MELEKHTQTECGRFKRWSTATSALRAGLVSVKVQEILVVSSSQHTSYPDGRIYSTESTWFKHIKSSQPDPQMHEFPRFSSELHTPSAQHAAEIPSTPEGTGYIIPVLVYTHAHYLCAKVIQ